MAAVYLLLVLLPVCLGVNLVNQPGASGPDVVETVVNLIRSNCIFSQDKLLLRRLAYYETRDGTLPKAYGNRNFHGGIWQVTESMFKSTLAQPVLQPMYKIVQDAFHFNWNNVKWTDLRKPLYSGLGAALYINLQIHNNHSSIPLKIEEQGTFLRDHYLQSSNPYNYTTLVEQMNVGCHSSSRQVDLVFLIDSSSSLSENDFKRIKFFLSDTVKGFNVGRYTTHVAVVTYASKVTVQFYLDNYVDRVAINTAIKNINYTSGATDTASAINTAINSVFSPTSGGRASASKVIVLITDGKSDDSINTQQAADIARSHGIAFFTVGVGRKIDVSELTDISTHPACTHSFTADGFESIANLRQEIQQSVCRAPLYANTTVTCQLSSCPPYAFPFTGSNGLTIKGVVSCGSAKIYADINNFFPSTSHNIFNEIIGTKETAHYQAKPDPNAHFLYVNIQPLSNTGCNITLTPLVGNQVVTNVEVLCREMPSGHERPCEKKDLLIMRPLICDGYTGVPNPCTQKDAQMGTKFPYPGDNTRYLQCLINGQFQVSFCPTGNVFDPVCRVCFGASAPLVDCTTSYNLSNPCTADNLLHQNFYFEYPGDHRKYIQCDIWGKPWERMCNSGELWVQEHLTCEMPGTDYNPCGQMNVNGQRFYTYPRDPTKFIECVDPLNPQVMSCQPGEIWADCQKTCELPALYTCVTLPPGYAAMTTRPPAFVNTAATLSPQGEIGSGYSYPCTKEHIENNELYFPVSGDHHKYVQCDLWGKGFIRTCTAPDPYYNPYSFTCVDGPVLLPVGKK